MVRPKAKARARRVEAEAAIRESISGWQPSKRNSPRSGRGRNSQGPHTPNRSEGLGRWQAYAQEQGRRNAGVPRHLIDDDFSPHPFTLSQEARNTERGFNRNYTNLRYNRVPFVSAGNLNPDELLENKLSEVSLDSPEDEDKNSAKEAASQIQASAQLQSSPEEHSGVPNNISVQEEVAVSTEIKPATASESQNDFFFIDTTGSRSPVGKTIPAPIIRSPSESPSSPSSPGSVSSEDEIVFTGRSISRKTPRQEFSRTSSSQRETFPAGWTNSAAATPQQGIHSKALPVGGARPTKDEKPETSMDHSPSVPPAKESTNVRSLGIPDFLPFRSSAPRRRKSRFDSSDDEGILNDYIANMVQDDTDDARSTTRHMNEIRGEQTAQASSFERRGRASSWSSADLDDLDALSTSDELPETVGRVYGKRSRKRGHQYLVVAEGQTPDDARWIKHDLLTMEGAAEAIRVYEEETNLPGHSESSDDFESDDDEEADADDLFEAMESEEDEMAVTEMLRGQMSDSQIARALHMQEQLGMATDEVLLFDGAFDEAEGRPKRSKPITSPRTPRSERKSRKRGDFPSAELFADVLEQDPYNGFDIMDFDRPSLRKKSKGKRANLPFELEDEELEAQMLQTWENDRLKKKGRKQQREELRAMGLLGGNKSSKKSPKNTIMDEAKEMIARFLLSEDRSLKLPPMAAHERLFMHQIATLFELDSKSHGPSSSRATILTKNDNTPDFDGTERIALLSMMDHKTVKKMPAQLSKQQKYRTSTLAKARHIRGGGGVMAGVSYRDGEVVGAAAPEIGAENKGRGMLEKMGWSQGMALGAVTNKGILHPIAHVVKNTKAGLG